jgi:hypothetical protein
MIAKNKLSYGERRQLHVLYLVAGITLLNFIFKLANGFRQTCSSGVVVASWVPFVQTAKQEKQLL